MMKNDIGKTFLVVLSAIFLGVFISISIENMSGRGEYYLSTNIIKSIEYLNGKLIVTTRDDMVSVCAKQTKSTPTESALCWVDTIDNEATISIYEYKTYYLWTKDLNGRISYYNKYNVQGKN